MANFSYIILLWTTLFTITAKSNQIALTVTTETHVLTYQNPINHSLADPFVLKHEGQYYLYATDNPRTGFEVYTSKDLLHWESKGMCWTHQSSDWVDTEFWAPEVTAANGKFYLHFTGFDDDSKSRNITMAVADSPLGSFTSLKAPLFPGISVIDSHIFIDADTKESVIYATAERRSPSYILGAPLAEDMVTLETTPTTCLTPVQGWEDSWIEAPFILKHKDLYYMLYSGSAFWEPGYGVGYAVSKSLLGPFERLSNEPLFTGTETVEGPGHNCVIESPDGTELMTLYHVHATPYTTRRLLAMDRIKFVNYADGPDRLITPEAPSTTSQPIPAGTTPLPRAVTDEFTTETLNRGQWNIVEENPERWRLKDGNLEIDMHKGSFTRASSNGENVFLQPAPLGAFTITTEVNVDLDRTDETVFITAWKDKDNFVLNSALFHDFRRMTVSIEQRAKMDGRDYPNEYGNRYHLKITYQDDLFTFHASKDGKTWDQLGTPKKTFWKPTHIGLGAWAPHTDRTTTARFNYIKLEEL